MKLMIAAALLAATSLAQAEQKDFRVVYEGFYDVQAKQFDPTLTLVANFTADDRNNDGTYAGDELVRFAAESIWWSGGVGCEGGGASTTCVLNFSYTPGGTPSFYAGKSVRDEMFPWGEDIEAGVAYVRYDTVSTQEWKWTSATRTFVNGVSVSPVPEPAQFGLMGIGLATLLLARRRRHH